MNNNYEIGNGFSYDEFLNTLGISSDNNSLFGSYDGFVRGNLFKDLYNEYKNYKPRKLSINSEKDEMLINLDQMGIALHELNLYLDVFPNDKDMLKKFSNYRETYNNLLEQYESKYGPICITDNNLDNIPFEWVDTIFPWEGDK